MSIVSKVTKNCSCAVQLGAISWNTTLFTMQWQVQTRFQCVQPPDWFCALWSLQQQTRAPTGKLVQFYDFFYVISFLFFSSVFKFILEIFLLLHSPYSFEIWIVSRKSYNTSLHELQILNFVSQWIFQLCIASRRLGMLL